MGDCRLPISYCRLEDEGIVATDADRWTRIGMVIGDCCVTLDWMAEGDLPRRHEGREERGVVGLGGLCGLERSRWWNESGKRVSHRWGGCTQTVSVADEWLVHF